MCRRHLEGSVIKNSISFAFRSRSCLAKNRYLISLINITCRYAKSLHKRRPSRSNLRSSTLRQSGSSMIQFRIPVPKASSSERIIVPTNIASQFTLGNKCLCLRNSEWEMARTFTMNLTRSEWGCRSVIFSPHRCRYPERKPFF